MKPPGGKFSLAIQESDEEGELLVATHTARRVPLSDGSLARALAFHPLMTLKVIGGIHWEALRL